MLKTRPSSARRTALLGVSAVVLALGSSALAVPGASAATPSASPLSQVPSQDGTSSTSNNSPAVSGEAKHDENFKFMQDERIANWIEYRVTGEHEITFTVITGTPSCYDVRAEVVEKNGTLKVALVEGTILGAPDGCTEEALYKDVKVKTKAKASTLKVQQLPKSQVHLNKKITPA
jgi:hypothetical protein